MRRNRFLTAVLLALAVGSACVGCGENKAAPAAAGTEMSEAAATIEAETEAEETEAGETEAKEAASSGISGTEETTLRVGALKGPTAMGLVRLMKQSEEGKSRGRYRFTIATQPDEVAAKMAAGDLDVALIPANMASVLYNKTEGRVSVIDINTLGVLYCVTGDDSIRTVKDFAGKTVITTGQGATPEHVLTYLLKQNGVTDCSLEFKSEATEIAAALKADPSRIAVLPQPFATVATMQNDAVRTAFSLMDAWDELKTDSRLVTGVTVVRDEVLREHPDAVDCFLEEQGESVEFANTSPSAAAELIASYQIVEKAPVAEKALPLCNIVCISGEEMKTALSGYLETLHAADPKSVGGSLPADDFYYLP